MNRFLVVIEKTDNNFSAYSPDLPGCVATGNTREETEQNMYEAIRLHVEGMKEDRLPIPESSSFAECSGCGVIVVYPPTQKTSGVSPGMNALDGPAGALAKAGW